MDALLNRIAAKILAAQDPFFSVKMKLNELVLREVAKAAFPGIGDTQAQNDAAIALLESSIHDHINSLAREIVDEADRIKRESQSPMQSAPESEAAAE